MIARARRSSLLLASAALLACACGQPATHARTPTLAPVEPSAITARARDEPPTAATGEPAAAAPARGIPRGDTVRVTPDEERLVLGTDVVVRVGMPERDAATGTDRAHVVLRAGAEVREETIPCDAPFSFHGLAITVEGGASFMNDHLVGYAIDAAPDTPSPVPECASDADCTLSMFACCGTVCAPRVFHVDVLAAGMERCARRVCAAAPTHPCTGDAPPTRAACVEEVCVAVSP